MPSASELIERYNMRQLPGEGGYYVETYRSDETIPHDVLPGRYCGDRSHSTCILFLLTKGLVSALHRVKSDEIYHFYACSPLRTLLLYPDGTSELVTVSNDLQARHCPQLVIPRGTWQGSFLAEPDSEFALLGCTVSPGFEFEDFEIPDNPAELIKQYPDRAELIRKLSVR